MSTKKTDISQIRKYLNGELDNLAMHQLERDAQDDPFLMDAMDGYEQATGLQQRNLDELDNRLQQRIDQSKVRRLIPWKYYSAASVLIVFTLGYLLWPAKPNVLKQAEVVTVKTETPAVTDHVVVKADTLPIAADRNLVAANAPPRKSRSKISNAGVKPTADALAEVRVDEPVGNADVKAVTVAESTNNSLTNNNFNANRALNAANVANKSFGYNGYVNNSVNVKKDSINNGYALASALKASKKDSISLKEITIGGYSMSAKKDSTGLRSQTLLGKVVGAKVTTQDQDKKASGQILSELGLPLTGVTVKVDGKAITTRTDDNGRFSLPAKEGETLSIAAVGYAKKQVKAKSTDSMKVALQPNTSSLSEVVVGYGTVKRKTSEASPRMGWDAYNKYLKSKAITTADKTGTVRLSFTVDEKGALSNFNLIKSANQAIDQQAIALVKDGPAWFADASGQAKTVKLKIVFRKE